jgi:succinoglycan biosynthesis transport protein ExoP
LEEEIDLREYIEVLIRHWRWIAGLAVVAAVVALLVSFLLPPTYEATALVVITKARYVMRFDERFETVNDIQQPYKAYPALAMSDDLVMETMAALNSPLPEEEQDLTRFRKKLEAASGSDPSVVELRARDKDPEVAANLANTWAGVFVGQVNALYDESAEDARFFEAQLVTADEALQIAEQALIEFEARNQANVLWAQIGALRSQLSAYLKAGNAIELVIQDAASLKARVSMREGDAPSSLADDLAALLLQVEALSLEGDLPLQFELGGQAAPSLMTRPELVAFLDGLMASLETQSGELETRVAELEPEILRLQGELQAFNTEQDRLTRARDVARDTYTTLARKVDEARIAAQDESGEVRLASHAAVPTDPVSPRKLLNTAVAGMLGLFVGVFGAFALEYWRQGKPAAEPIEEEEG